MKKSYVSSQKITSGMTEEEEEEEERNRQTDRQRQ